MEYRVSRQFDYNSDRRLHVHMLRKVQSIQFQLMGEGFCGSQIWSSALESDLFIVKKCRAPGSPTYFHDGKRKSC
jgi:hypothetical protein